MPWLRHLAILFAFVAAFVRPAPASAFTPATSEARVGGFDVAAHLLAGELGAASLEQHQGIGAAYDENASGYRFAARSFGGPSRAAEFGIKPYGELTGALRGTGLQAHHLVEQRFGSLFGGTAREGLSVAVTRAEHQVFTNRWRELIPYGPGGTGAATRESVLGAARDVYRNYPEILKALGL